MGGAKRRGGRRGAGENESREITCDSFSPDPLRPHVGRLRRPTHRRDRRSPARFARPL